MSRLRYIKDIKLNELSAERILRAVGARLADLPHYFAWHLNTKLAREHKKKLASFHNIHKGKRCFIVANGPSLKDTDLSLLKDEYTFGMNRIYLNAEKSGFLPKFIVVMDIDIQLMQFTADYDDLKLTKFFNWNARKLFSSKPNLTYFRCDFPPKFSTDMTESAWGGHSVNNVCIQLAYYMGFDEVYLVGKDHSYEKTGVPGALVKSTGNESNHFIKGYYKPGMSWRIPDYKGEELAYTMAKEAFEKSGRKIFDATINGKLNIFPKVDYYSLFKES